MNRRLLLVLLLVVVIGGGLAAALLLGGGGGPTPSGGGATADPNQVTGGQQQPLVTVPPTWTPYPVVEIVIAVQEIPRGVAITPDMIDIRQWPADFAPFNSFNNTEEVIGQIARTDIGIEQPVLSTLLVPDLLNLAAVGSDAAAVLPSNRVAVAIPMDRITSVAYAIRPGDRVDVIVSMLFVDVDRTFQSLEPNGFQLLNVTCLEPPCGDPDDTIVLEASTNVARGSFDTRLIPSPLGSLTWPVFILPAESQRPRLATQRTIQDALVVWTGDFPLNGRMFEPAPTPTPIPPTPVPGQEPTPAEGPPTPTPLPPRPNIVTLGVSPQDAVVLTWLAEARIPITFALRSAQAGALVQTDTVSLDYIMQRFRITVPDRFEYNIEPAIRSIRQLSLGDEISLDAAP